MSCLIPVSLIVPLTLIKCFSVFVNAKKGFGPGSQEYGYVEVRKGAHLFYWLYYINTVEEKSAPNHPLVIWLQGGPGGSSTGMGNFEEFGTLDTNLKQRKFAWTKLTNVLFLDNPVGTGFSYVNDQSLLVKTNQEISDDLVTFTKEFYKKFPKFSETPLYIFSESYGGKMAIQFAYDLYNEIKKHELKINLKGVALGDSWISPLDSCLTWGPYLWNLGVVDKSGYDKITKYGKMLKKAVDEKQWFKATGLFDLLEGAVVDATDGVDFYNVLHYQGDATTKGGTRNNRGLGLYGRMAPNQDLESVMNKQVKSALKSVIPSSVIWYDVSSDVFEALEGDFMRPVTHYVEKVLNSTTLDVVVYTGQLDLIVDTLGTMKWVYALRWPGVKDWLKSDRTSLNVYDRREGYFKSNGRFRVYWINRAGHMVPIDNPVGALGMLAQVTNATSVTKKRSSQYA